MSRTTKKVSTRNTAVGEEDVKIGYRMRVARIEAGFTQISLAEKFDVSPQQIQKFESGHNRISAKMLHRLSVLCNKSLDWYFQDFNTEKGESKERVMNSKFAVRVMRYLHEVQDRSTQKKVLSIIKLLVATDDASDNDDTDLEEVEAAA